VALTLDLTGKFVLVTIVVAVATGIILGFQGDISGSIANILGDGEVEGAETVQVSGSSNQKIASLIDSCYKKSLKKSVESFVCFIVQSDSDFSFSESTVKSSLSSDVRDKTDFKASSPTSSVVISYEHTTGEIVVQ
jgi:hypothetical protein